MIYLVSTFNCPSCGALLRKDSTSIGVVVFCQNERCESPLTDNGAEARTESEAHTKLELAVMAEQLEKDDRTVQEEAEEREERMGDYKHERDRANDPS